MWAQLDIHKYHSYRYDNEINFSLISNWEHRKYFVRTPSPTTTLKVKTCGSITTPGVKLNVGSSACKHVVASFVSEGN